MTTATRFAYHAGNVNMLARVRKVFNAKVYAKAREIYNQGGKLAVREYIGTFYNAEARERCLAAIFDGPDGTAREMLAR